MRNEQGEIARAARPLVVAHVVLSLDVGGLERLVIDLVRENMRLGYGAAVVCLERRGELASQAEALGARVVCAEKRPGFRPALVQRLANQLRGIRPDVVHTHQIGALFYAGPAARRAETPVVVHTEHGKHYSNRLRTRVLGRLAARYADKFCCVSQDIADEVRKARIVRENKIDVVANGIDTARFQRRTDTTALRSQLRIPVQAPVVGTIGRLNEIKRQDLLIRAFASLLQRRPDAHLLIVGDGPLRGMLKQLALSVLPEGQFHFVGYQAEPERYLQLMDAFALTSRSEGMPLVILEAWAAGVPVIASRVGGVPELVRDGQTGFLFDGDDELGLSELLNSVLSDECLAMKVRHAVRERVNNEFSLSQTARAYQGRYLELLNGTGVPS
jgi:glycosyltransferase involved in cell wall biosynthesis